MENPVVVYSSAKLVVLQVIAGKLGACDIEAIIQEKTFQGAGKLHELLVSESKKARALEIIAEDTA